MNTSSIQNLLSTLPVLPAIIALLVVTLFGLVIYFISQQLKNEDNDTRVTNQIIDTFESELVGEKKHKKQNALVVKWSDFWQKRIMGSGLKIPLLTQKNIGSRMLIFFISIFVIASVLTRQPAAGFAFMLLSCFVIVVILGFTADKHQQKLSGQVPGFLSSMRAGVQNNALPQNALMAAIRDAPDSLYEELRPLEQEMLAGGNLRDTLMRFYSTTSIDELRFLMACIVLSIDRGQDLDEQLGIIQDIVETRAKRRRHIQQAISSFIPTLSICSAILPLIFIFMYMMDSTTHDYWFHSLISWVMLFLAVVIWGAGVFFAKHSSDSIKKLN